MAIVSKTTNTMFLNKAAKTQDSSKIHNHVLPVLIVRTVFQGTSRVDKLLAKLPKFAIDVYSFLLHCKVKNTTCEIHYICWNLWIFSYSQPVCTNTKKEQAFS